MLQICEAVAFLHTRRPQPIIHRDIKPPNIKITPQGRALLVDFGIAKVYHPTKGTAKVAKAVTPHFSSPEQHIARTDARSDVYSLGATLYFLVCGTTPPDAMERLNHGAAVVPPSRTNPTVSQALEQIIMQAIALNPDQRFLNANRMAAALRAYLTGAPAAAAAGVPAAARPGTCPRCGWQNRPAARFCVKDGTPLPGAAAVPAQAPAQAAPPPPPAPELTFERANNLARQRNFAQAIPLYEACLQQGFTDQAAYFNLGLSYLEVKRYPEAASVLEKGAAQYPHDADLQYQLAQAYTGMHRPDQALACAARAHKLAPQDALICKHYGRLLFEARRYSDAIPVLERAIQLDSKSSAMHLLLGRAYGEHGDYRKAANKLQQAAQLDGQTPEPWLWQGIYAYRQRRYRDSISALESALRLDPDSAAAHYWIGEAWLQLAQYPRALPYFQKAVLLQPGEPSHHTRLAQCYVQMRRKPEARAAVLKALQLDPAYSPAQDLLKRLN
jgi:tetratricopeptide (TPR) repeat protein